MTQTLYQGCAPAGGKPELIGRRLQCKACGTVLLTTAETTFEKPEGWNSKYFAVSCPTCTSQIAISTETNEERFDKELKDVRDSVYRYAQDGGKYRREMQEKQDSFNEKVVITLVIYGMAIILLALGVAFELGWIH